MNGKMNIHGLMHDSMALAFSPVVALRTWQDAMRRTVSSANGHVLDKETPFAIESSANDSLAPFSTVPASGQRTTDSWPYLATAAEVTLSEAQPEGGRFIDGSITNLAGTRDYKLYIPSCYRGQSLPLVVMLHGCKQDPDDFAAGTRMNAMAEEKQCFVLYPAQSKIANSPKCWSWFNAVDQERERGEPSMIADMTREIIRSYQIEASMVYVAGLSAGGAMAVIMATEYPDIFAAAAVHSGMPYNAARNLFSALSAMKHGPQRRWYDQFGNKPESQAPAVPMIVFHGDADTVVHPRNGEQVIKEAVAGTLCAETEALVDCGLPERRSYTRTVYHDETGNEMAEQWVIHGSGHGWSGGCSDGSYTDPNGPDASYEMMRFFLERKLAAYEDA
jgi:poly(hydroxyalkanoate) depolymerase family esterase